MLIPHVSVVRPETAHRRSAVAGTRTVGNQMGIDLTTRMGTG